jgi:outer membrane scaffolding protein for murein synthesis (MipA/OmpV family)
MVRLRCMLTAIALGATLVSHTAVAQGSSVSLTHVVTVTVPPRVKVQVSNVAPAPQTAATVSSRQTPTDGLALSISATQSWTLSINSAGKKSDLQWSHDRSSGFARVGRNDATVASGTLSQIPTDATVFFRNAAESVRSDTEGSDAVMLTVVAQ